MLTILAFMVTVLSGTTQPPESPQTRPAEESLPPATAPATQPVTPLGKYYNLTRTMFMKDADGHIVMTTSEVDRLIVRIREAALKDKAQVDQQITSAAADVKKAMAAQDIARAKARDSLAAARKHVDQTDHTDYGANRRRVRAEARHNAQEVALARNAVEAAKREQQNAQKAEDEVRAASGRLQALRTRSAQLNTISLPTYRNVPPKQFWSGLSASEQALMGQVGITLPEFKTLLGRVGLTEEDFLKMAKKMEESGSNDRTAQELRAFFQKNLAPKGNPK